MSNEKAEGNYCQFIRIFFFAIIWIFSIWVQAAPVDSYKAEKTVKGWLKQNRKPLNTQLSAKIRSVDTYTDQAGETQYFVVNLQPEGYVIISSDDELEPIIAFSQKGIFDSSLSTPLGLLMHKDTLVRSEKLKHILKQKKSNEKSDKQKKWDLLTSKEDQSYNISYELSEVTDVRVAPLVQSEWGQTHDGTGDTNYCYNYYTPNHYPCGCVATAMAQLMRYHQYPMAGIGLHTEQIEVDGDSENATTRGGDGSGGAYSWANMPLVPIEASATQRSAIGALCFDAGVAVGMSYAESGSGAFLFYPAYATDADRALVDVFGFSNCIGGYNVGGILIAQLNQMINPNLDAELPVILGIYDSANPSSSGHAILADGYGYDNQTLYHHLNMGWQGQGDVWYALPVIDAGTTGYYSDIIDECLYNIYMSETGEIVSGRVMDLAGLPIENILVKAKQGVTVVAEDFTDPKGIYALINLPSDQTFMITVEQDGNVLSSVEKTTGLSLDGSVDYGNVWEVDFSGIQTATPPVASDINLELFDANPVTIELLATDDHLPLPPGKVEYIVTSLPEHGWLYDPNDNSKIVDVPYTLENDSNSVTYQPCPYYFAGQDIFTFMANDGGVAPAGGDSNIADVNMIMDIPLEIEYEEEPTTRNGYFPFKTDSMYVRCQALYHADRLGNMPKKIINLALKIKKNPSIGVHNWKIRMKHTTLESQPSGEAAFDNSGWTDVYDANEIIDANDGDWYEFVLDSEFRYDGVRNLMIDFSFDNSGNIDAPTDGGDYGFVYNALGTERRILANWGDSEMPTHSISYNFLNHVFNIKLIPQLETLEADFNDNCSVGVEDLMMMVDAWLAQSGDVDYNPDCDISLTKDDKINLGDFAVFASEWLENMNPNEIVYSIADFDKSRSVDVNDLVIMSQAWLTQVGDGDYNLACDISATVDEKIDLADFAVFVSEWQQ
jgi:hypothetical protein